MIKYKFRAWDKSAKRIHYDVMTDGRNIICGFDVIDKGEDVLIDPIIYSIPNSMFELMIFINKKDAYNKDIFVGDILGLEDPEDKSTCEVIFENGSFKKKFITREGEVFSTHFDNFDVDWIVIGNIYENSELLK